MIKVPTEDEYAFNAAESARHIVNGHLELLSMVNEEIQVTLKRNDEWNDICYLSECGAALFLVKNSNIIPSLCLKSIFALFASDISCITT